MGDGRSGVQTRLLLKLPAPSSKESSSLLGVGRAVWVDCRVAIADCDWMGRNAGVCLCQEVKVLKTNTLRTLSKVCEAASRRGVGGEFRMVWELQVGSL